MRSTSASRIAVGRDVCPLSRTPIALTAPHHPRSHITSDACGCQLAHTPHVRSHPLFVAAAALFTAIASGVYLIVIGAAQAAERPKQPLAAADASAKQKRPSFFLQSAEKAALNTISESLRSTIIHRGYDLSNVTPRCLPPLVLVGGLWAGANVACPDMT